MDFRAEYEKWCTDPYFDEATKAELKAMYSRRAWRCGMTLRAYCVRFGIRGVI